MGHRLRSGTLAQAGPARVRVRLLPPARAPRPWGPRSGAACPVATDVRLRPTRGLGAPHGRSTLILLAPAACSAARHGSRRAVAAVVPPSLLHLPRFATPPAPPRPRLSRTRTISAVHAQVRANLVVFLLRCPPWPPLADARGRSSLHPFFLFGLEHKHRLHLAVLVRASLAATTACTGRPPCASAASPPCTPASSVPSSSGRTWSTPGFTSQRGTRWCPPRHRRIHRQRDPCGQRRVRLGSG
jgi:hypothetical protein